MIRGDEAIPPSLVVLILESTILEEQLTGNLSFGYFSGSGWSYISRIDYSNDNTNMLQKDI